MNSLLFSSIGKSSSVYLKAITPHPVYNSGLTQAKKLKIKEEEHGGLLPSSPPCSNPLLIPPDLEQRRGTGNARRVLDQCSCLEPVPGYVLPRRLLVPMGSFYRSLGDPAVRTYWTRCCSSSCPLTTAPSPGFCHPPHPESLCWGHLALQMVLWGRVPFKATQRQLSSEGPPAAMETPS